MVAERVSEARPDFGVLCRQGHKRTYRNLYRDSEGTRRCLECVRAARRRWDRAHPRTRADRGRLATPGDLCRNGHERRPETTIQKRGYRLCLICRRANDREWQRLKRLRARQQAERSLGIALAPNRAPRPSQAPLSGFDAVVAAQVAQVRDELAARVGYSDRLKRARVERLRRAEERFAAMGTPEPAAVIRATADTFGLNVADLTGKDRHSDFAWPRQLCYYAIRTWCDSPLFDVIGRLFGGRDHTTICYGHDKIARLVAAGDVATLRDLAEIRAALVEAVTA